ncbi:hypothetical protein FHX37_2687 [Haloactinospora alba]|uniref:Uncharacterized protein n=1 Tax=Haloactinospora alba TaxID=405555 RepID=A0A543NLM3_9ACTN|nr:hypothetical protein [Haloactinospora alba]TQN32709.1 hypothetical protein FHX37_2687 [Haloactinospora alba]
MAGQPPYPPPGPQQPNPPQQPPPGYGPPGGQPPPPGYPAPPQQQDPHPPWNSGPPGPGYPQRPSRGRGWLIGGIAGGAAVLFVAAGITTWAVVRTPPPLSGVADCDAFLTESELSGVPDAESSDIIEDRYEESMPVTDGGVTAEEALLCSTGSGTELSERPVLQVSVFRFPTDTAEDDYTRMQQHLSDVRTEMGESYDVDLSEDASSPEDGSIEVGKREMGTGDGGFVYYVDDPNSEYLMDDQSLAWATFVSRNLMVNVGYSGSDGLSPEEKLEVADDLASTVEGTLTRASETEYETE